MLHPLPLPQAVESKYILRKVAMAHKALAELKGVITSIPNENITPKVNAVFELMPGLKRVSDIK